MEENKAEQELIRNIKRAMFLFDVKLILLYILWVIIFVPVIWAVFFIIWEIVVKHNVLLIQTVLAVTILIAITAAVSIYVRKSFKKNCEKNNFTVIEPAKFAPMVYEISIFKSCKTVFRGDINYGISNAADLNIENGKAYVADIVYTYRAGRHGTAIAGQYDVLVWKSQYSLPYFKIAKRYYFWTTLKHIFKPSEPAQKTYFGGGYNLYCADENRHEILALLKTGLMREIAKNKFNIETDGQYLIIFKPRFGLMLNPERFVLNALSVAKAFVQ